MSTYIYYGDTLYHHGVKGQKWGLRRYQNKDGSLTPEGREHYGYSSDNIAYREGLKRATLRGGFVGRYKYKKENAAQGEKYKQEKQFLKSAKKIRKKEAYRDRIVNYNNSQASRNENLAKRYRDEAKDLKKYGSASETYKKYVDRKMNDYSVYDDFYTMAAKMVSDASTHNYYYKQYADVEVKKLLDSTNKNARSAIKRAKLYAQSNEQLMNMPINELTKKRDIRRAARVNHD